MRSGKLLVRKLEQVISTLQAEFAWQPHALGVLGRAHAIMDP